MGRQGRLSLILIHGRLKGALHSNVQTIHMNTHSNQFVVSVRKQVVSSALPYSTACNHAQQLARLLDCAVTVGKAQPKTVREPKPTCPCCKTTGKYHALDCTYFTEVVEGKLVLCA